MLLISDKNIEKVMYIVDVSCQAPIVLKDFVSYVSDILLYIFVSTKCVKLVRNIFNLNIHICILFYFFIGSKAQYLFLNLKKKYLRKR